MKNILLCQATNIVIDLFTWVITIVIVGGFTGIIYLISNQ